MTDPNEPRGKYDYATIERRWQQRWLDEKTFRTPNPGDPDFDPARPKLYVLDMFPYPSGVGLHVGHPLGYIATDIVARFARMRGFSVLHPMGFDAFGLPAEQFAVEHGVHPRVTTEQNIANMRLQLQRLGLSYDWDRELATTDVDYYRWTQWVFLQLYNSYFDPVDMRAMPIDHLVDKLQGNDYVVGLDGSIRNAGIDEDMDAISGTPIGPRKWYELQPHEQQAFIDDHRLAYLTEVGVNWCPALGTVLANEEVTADGRSERGNHPVYQRPLEQWMLRITAYADRLADELDGVDWPESVKALQRNWIGRSEGAEVDFALDRDQTTLITVFTTRPDTLFGATYMVLAPEHELVDEITTPEHRHAVDQYVAQAAARSDIDRMAAPGNAQAKTGVFTGAYAVNPVNDQRVPIWIADYVLTGYGTGAIMAVPAHDDRDFEFAKAFDLPIRPVVRPADETPTPGSNPAAPTHAFTGDGVSMHSANAEVALDGLPTPQAKQRITDWLASKGLGRGRVQYKLRDWLFSRQRYWGEPFPILHELDDAGRRTGRIVALDAGELPVTLPEMDDFSPIASDDPAAPPRPPLAKAPAHWRVVERDGVRYERELNTMPQWAGSCWYYLRFADPRNDQSLVRPDAERYWMNPSGQSDRHPSTSQINQAPMGVDLYVGGVEHAVLHLLYARFWHKVLYDLGHVSTPEPFGRLFNQGYIQAYCYRDARGVVVPALDVVNAHGAPALEVQGQPGQTFFHNKQPVTEEYGKMGKSLKNAVSPDDISAEYGCDTLRLYEMYLGPLEASKPWATRDIIGVHRFLQRVWRNFVEEQTDALRVADQPAHPDQLRALHKTIAGVTDDMNRMAFNTAIAKLIELNNQVNKWDALPRAVAEPFVLMLAPLAPHIAEELWARMGHPQMLAYAFWPQADPQHLVEDTIELPVQVMGKLRTRITVAADADQASVEAAAQADPNVAAHLEGKTVHKIVYVPGKMMNIVAN